jgi:type I restriction enzyme S subunit
MKPGYKQTEVGVIPEEWEVSIIGDLCAAVLDCHHSTPVWTASGSIVIRNQNIRDGKLDLSQPSFTDETHFAERTRRAVPSFGDLVITREAPMGLVCMIPKGLKCCLGQRMVLLRPNHDAADTHYFLYALLSEAFQRSISVAGGTGSTVSNLRIPVLKGMEIPAPPLPEQRAIAAALSDVDGLLGGLDRLIAKKRDLKQAAMQQLLTGQTRLPGFHGEWEVKRLGDVVETDPENLGSGTSRDYAFRYISLEDVDQGTLKGFTEQVFATAPSRARRKLRANDVLVSTVRPNLLSHLFFQGNEPNWVCSTGFCVLRCREGVTHAGYIFQHLFAAPVNRQIEALLTGSNYPSMNSRDVRALEVPLPSYTEQTAIAEVLTEMDGELAALEQRREKIRALKQAMMQELLTGRTRLL